MSDLPQRRREVQDFVDAVSKDLEARGWCVLRNAVEFEELNLLESVDEVLARWQAQVANALIHAVGQNEAPRVVACFADIDTRLKTQHFEMLLKLANEPGLGVLVIAAAFPPPSAWLGLEVDGVSRQALARHLTYNGMSLADATDWVDSMSAGYETVRHYADRRSVLL